jgi:restriction endonuclease S subunit
MSNEIPEGFKITDIGAFPEEWDIMKLGDIAEVLNGYAFISDDYVEDGILNSRIINIRDSGRIDIISDAKYLPKHFAELYSKYLLHEGDILIVMVGATRGKLAYITSEGLPALMNQNMWKIVTDNTKLVSEYLYLYLNQCK